MFRAPFFMRHLRLPTRRVFDIIAVMNKILFAVLAGGGCSFVGAATIDLVSAKGVDATVWVELESPGDGALTAQVQAPAGFGAKLLRVTKELRDPNAYFTDLPGIGEKVPVGTGLADAAQGAPAKAGEKVRFRVVVPVGETAAAGLHKGKVTLACGGRSAESELNLKVLDFVLPPAKTRLSGRAWTAKYEGGVPADWTPEQTDTYAKHAADVTAVAASMKAFKSDLAAERWRAFGVGYFGVLDVPYVVNPDAWRRVAGVAAWQRGYDGVVWPADRKADPVVRAGLDDALIDVRYVSYCLELSNPLANKEKRDSKVVYEGRLGQFWVDRIKTASDDMDVVRLEAQARLVRLLAFAKKEGLK